jgi:hypothetical protein
MHFLRETRRLSDPPGWKRNNKFKPLVASHLLDLRISAICQQVLSEIHATAVSPSAPSQCNLKPHKTHRYHCLLLKATAC